MFLVVNYRAQMNLCCMNCPAIFKKLFLKIVLRILCLWILFRKISARASEELWTFAVCSVYFNSVGMGVFFLFLVRNSCVSIKSLCCLKMSLLPCGYFFSHICVIDMGTSILRPSALSVGSSSLTVTFACACRGQDSFAFIF